MKANHLLIALLSLALGACGMGDNAGSPDLVTEMPVDAAAAKAVGAEGLACLEGKGHWNKREEHCLVTQELCGQVGDWAGKSCVLPVTDCIEEGSHKEGSKCVVEYYSKEHMQTIVAAKQ